MIATRFPVAFNFRTLHPCRHKTHTAVAGTRLFGAKAYAHDLFCHSEIRLEINSGTVAGDGGGRRAGVEEEARRQELRRGG